MLQRGWIIAIVILVAITSNVGAATIADPSQKPGQAGKGRSPAQVIRKLDADKDGQVSKSEFAAAKSKAATRGKGKAGAGRGKAFDRLDANGNGSLSASELQQLRNRRTGGGKTGARGGLPQ